MDENRRLDIPKVCRGFGTANLDKRLQFAREFVSRFVESPAPPKELDDRDESWTRWVRKRFVEICPRGCYALPDDPSSRKGDYLVEYTWAEEAEGRRVLLACECEWGTGWFGDLDWFRVEQDFEKLLAVKAPFKVLIFSSSRKSDKSNTDFGLNFSLKFAQKRLKKSLENYWHHLVGEVYVFIDFPRTGIRDNDGEYESFVWLAKNSTKVHVDFQPGPCGRFSRPS